MMHIESVRRTLLLSWLLAMPWLPFQAARAGIVDTGFVVQAIERGAIVWDVRSEEEYRRGHIPGGVNIDDPQSVLRDGKNEDYLTHPWSCRSPS